MPKLKTYDVEYVITRSETYRIEAADKDDAEDRAFSEGELRDDTGETTQCEPLDCVLVKPEKKKSKALRAGLAAVERMASC